MKIKELFSDASKWTQEVYANHRATGEPENAWCFVDKTYEGPLDNPDVYSSFCLTGAVRACYGVADRQVVLSRLADAIGYDTAEIPEWNDNPLRTFQDVKDLVERLDI